VTRSWCGEHASIPKWCHEMVLDWHFGGHLPLDAFPAWNMSRFVNHKKICDGDGED